MVELKLFCNHKVKLKAWKKKTGLKYLTMSQQKYVTKQRQDELKITE